MPWKLDFVICFVVHVLFVLMWLVAFFKDIHWERPGKIRRGEASWWRFFLIHGLLLLLLFQVLGTTNVSPNYNWRPLVSVIDFFLVSYLALFNGWFRNWLLGLFNRLEHKPE